jgi:hypothetical protein
VHTDRRHITTKVHCEKRIVWQVHGCGHVTEYTDNLDGVDQRLDEAPLRDVVNIMREAATGITRLNVL